MKLNKSENFSIVHEIYEHLNNQYKLVLKKNEKKANWIIIMIKSEINMYTGPFYETKPFRVLDKIKYLNKRLYGLVSFEHNSLGVENFHHINSLTSKLINNEMKCGGSKWDMIKIGVN